jgi:hypothetical protein
MQPHRVADGVYVTPDGRVFRRTGQVCPRCNVVSVYRGQCIACGLETNSAATRARPSRTGSPRLPRLK